MLRSMTAFGRAVKTFSFGRITVEIQSVNRKHLELRAQLPKEFGQFEADVRNWLSPHVARGQVSLRVSVAWEGATPVEVHLNMPIAEQYLDLREKLAKKLGQTEGGSFVDWLLSREGVVTVECKNEDEKLYRQALEEAIQEALKPFITMKEREGSEIANDFLKRLATMQGWVIEIAERSKESTLKVRERILKTLQDTVPDCVGNDERLLREVVLFADKVDITEEVVRFSSHVKQIEALLASPNSQIGKQLEFIIQELARESNTMGMKGVDLSASHLVVSLKTEIERLREQVQNVE